MTVNKDERATIAIIRDPGFAIAAVEGEYKGERRVFLCLMRKRKDGNGFSVDAPLAMLLDEEKDFRHIKNHDGAEPGAPKIEIVKG